MCREVKKAKPDTSRAGRVAPAPMPASRMPYDVDGLTEVDLSHAPKRWSEERCKSSLAKVMNALKVLIKLCLHNRSMQVCVRS